jgi:pimeloyl-ACP methyl ester carboxylesterase
MRRVVLVAAAATAIVALVIGGAVLVATRDSGGADDPALEAPLVADGYTPVLDSRDCPEDASASGTDIECYDLVVPETLSDPTGRQVRIPVLIAPSRASNPGVPLVVLGSGFNGLSLSQGDVRDYAQSITMGARGGDFATPKLTCPEIAATLPQQATLPSAGAEAKRLYLDAAEQCGKRLEAEGVDLDAYGLRDVADDVIDLAVARGWREFNLEAHWQYSRVPNLIAAAHPGLVRSVVLVDPAPPDASTVEDVAAWNEAVQAYYAACRADAGCSQSFPDMGASVQALYERLERQRPLVTTTNQQSGEQLNVLLDGATSVSALLSALQIGPEAIASALRLDDAGLNSILAGIRADFSMDDPSAEGARLSQLCEDDEPALLPGGAQVTAAAYPLLGVFATNDADLEVCPRWPTEQRSGVIGAFRPTNPAPALIISGGLNPFSPPSYARAAATAFTETTVAVFPSLSSFAVLKGPPCVAALRLQFLRDPHADLDVETCVNSAPPLHFE